MSEEIRVCECCGHPLPDDAVDAVLSPQQRRIFQLVKRGGRNWLPGDAIADVIYADRSDGGPNNPKIVICVLVRKINKKIALRGLKIKGQAGPGGGYRLDVV